jgi:hypothetical protein
MLLKFIIFSPERTRAPLALLLLAGHLDDGCSRIGRKALRKAHASPRQAEEISIYLKSLSKKKTAKVSGLLFRGAD